MIDIKELDHMLSSLKGCCLHEPRWDVEDVDMVLCGIWGDTYHGWKDAPKEDTDCSSIWVVRLKDGSYGLLRECDSFTGRYELFVDLMFHLDEAERDAVTARMARDVDPEMILRLLEAVAV